MNPYGVTADLEAALCEYTGAKYAVCVNSCTAALLLSLMWVKKNDQSGFLNIVVPKRTYVSVAMAVKMAGFNIVWSEDYWRGAYALKRIPDDGSPFVVWDCARRFTSGMYEQFRFQCVSFATAKILGIEQGGAILHDSAVADQWFRRMRFDGRTEGVEPKDDNFDLLGHHCIMLPSIAAQLLLKLHHLPRDNEDLPDYDYPDLSGHPAFKSKVGYV